MGKGLVRFTLPELWREEPRTGPVPGWASLGTNILAHPANKQFSCLQYVGILRTNRFSLDFFFFKVIRSNVSQAGLKFTDLAEDDLELLLRLQTCTSTSSFVLCWGPNYILGPSPDLVNLLSSLAFFS